jgi:iron complex outermembrane recepter protein
MWWAAVSRPIREPSRVEENTRTVLFFADPGALVGRPTGTIVPFLLTGNPDLEPEAILAWELGYRTRPADRVTTDFALFHNHYDDYIFVPPQGLGSFNNEGEAESFGGEAALTWEASSSWQLRGSYSCAEVEVSGPINQSDEGSTPRHQAQLRSFLDLRSDLELDGALYFVDRREVADVDPYWKLDLGVVWRPRPELELGLWGQNLLEESRREASPLEAVERGAYVVATYRF